MEGKKLSKEIMTVTIVALRLSLDNFVVMTLVARIRVVNRSTNLFEIIIFSSLLPKYSLITP